MDVGVPAPVTPAVRERIDHVRPQQRSAPALSPEARAQVRAERVAQGLPPTVEDPVVLARVADLVRQAQRRQATS